MVCKCSIFIVNVFRTAIFIQYCTVFLYNVCYNIFLECVEGKSNSIYLLIIYVVFVVWVQSSMHTLVLIYLPTDFGIQDVSLMLNNAEQIKLACLETVAESPEPSHINTKRRRRVKFDVTPSPPVYTKEAGCQTDDSSFPSTGWVYTNHFQQFMLEKYLGKCRKLCAVFMNLEYVRNLGHSFL